MDIGSIKQTFSNPANLQKITPNDLGFKILSKHHGAKMYPGQIIEYKVKPVLGIPIYWMTEITHVKDKEFFVDEQRVGPYKIWHHEHHFKAVAGGVEMTDIVTYVLPLGILGRLVHPFLVRPKLEQIFAYRFQKVDAIFK